MVKNCRMQVYETNQGIKKADCAKDANVKSEEVRSCISMRMTEKQANYKFEERADQADLLTKDFFECMHKVFK